MTLLDDTQLDQLYEQYSSAWQNQLLAEMGITRWVSQSCPVKAFDELDDLAVIFENQNHEVPVSKFESEQTTLVNQQHNLQHPVEPTDNYLSANTPVHAEPVFESFTDFTPPYQSEFYAGDLQASADNTDEILTTSFDLQAIVVGEWTLLVDSNALQQDPRQMQLWQQIVSNLKSQLYFFKFPLLGESDKLPDTTIQLMSTYPMAIAGVSGFLFSINKGNPKVGALTLLPDCLAQQPFQRLPYLSEMLEDYRLKRQLWQLLTR